MRLGIDFGTTRTVVALVDRGNYPAVSFTDDTGDSHEFFPSVVAEVDGSLVFGFDALAAARDGAPLMRSFKRMLGSPEVSAHTEVHIGGVRIELHALVRHYLEALLEALKHHSNLPRIKKKTSLEVVVAVPAHAHLVQRFLTLDAFHQAGFQVNALMHEPSAAGFEYTHCRAKTISSRRTQVIVYDLGGGTFDASLVRVDGGLHEVLATSGLNRLGGDDFDELLAMLALQEAGVDEGTLSKLEKADLLESARDAKERLSPNARRIVVDGPITATIPVDRFYAAAAPLVEKTLDAMAPLLGVEDAQQLDADVLTEVAGVYLVGGASGLPLVPRLLRERFGRRVHKSPYPAASTAIGLAIAADEDRGFTLRDQFSRNFGVFRERNGGKDLSFDRILSPDMPIPEAGTTVVKRQYRAAHNIGHFRFAEVPADASSSGAQKAELDHASVRELLPFGEVFFAFDAELRDQEDLRDLPVKRIDAGVLIEERYFIDANGLVTVELEDVDAGYVREFSLRA